MDVKWVHFGTTFRRVGILLPRARFKYVVEAGDCRARTSRSRQSERSFLRGAATV